MKLSKLIESIERITGKKVILEDKSSFNYDRFEKKLRSICAKEDIEVEFNSSGDFDISFENYTNFKIKFEGYDRTDDGYIKVNNYSRTKINNLTQDDFFKNIIGIKKIINNVYILIKKAEKILSLVKEKDPSVDSKYSIREIDVNNFYLNTWNNTIKSKIYGDINIIINIKKNIVEFRIDEGELQEIKTSADFKRLFPNKSIKDIKLSNIVNEIKNDLDRFVSGGSQHSDVKVYGKKICKDVRDLGNWVHDQGREDEEDDDHEVWSSKSTIFYNKKFKEWISEKEWKKYVRKFDIETSEKNWVSYSIYLK